MDTLSPLREFIRDIEQVVAVGGAQVAERAAERMRSLLANDDWLPESMAEPHHQFYQQHLLYADPADRFSLVSFVWGPGQATPIHNHTVWGVIGVLRGAEYGQHYELKDGAAPCKVGGDKRLDAGQVEIVSPSHGDVHLVRNAYDDRVSISIHLYGGNIGRITRSVYDAQTGTAKDFVSGYSRTLEGFDPAGPLTRHHPSTPEEDAP
jgi:predicted metal-dependent enzyme (double-stranded beta helix superfamily)